MEAQASLATDVPNYVTASGYTEQLRVRTKVGDEQASGRIAFMPLAGGEVKWLRVIPSDTLRAPAFAFTEGVHIDATCWRLIQQMVHRHGEDYDQHGKHHA